MFKPFCPDDLLACVDKLVQSGHSEGPEPMVCLWPEEFRLVPPPDSDPADAPGDAEKRLLRPGYSSPSGSLSTSYRAPRRRPGGNAGELVVDPREAATVEDVLGAGDGDVGEHRLTAGNRAGASRRRRRRRDESSCGPHPAVGCGPQLIHRDGVVR
ncbi:hypothetical protein AB0G04_40785 [Actinoplanes sp. NPDC023801]|uniref:hypothetical protein n=1 Tax=Actinoplanes sp. NPDC023801 TaxID=3154595 RepID=UPI0033E423DE